MDFFLNFRIFEQKFRFLDGVDDHFDMDICVIQIQRAI